jgi:2-polyprenyl-3-methyl-5-hydroxy-6-metoxy-1,4-benzoquinol methylase
MNIQNKLISENGYWLMDPTNTSEHVYDEYLSDELVNYAKRINPKLIYDFGCGNGKYVNNFINKGLNIIGFDGNPNTKNILQCKVQDLTDKDFKLEPVDFLISLEVCEHVPQMLENILIDNINKHINKNGILVLSWAVKGQGGLGHVNCQNNDYVINKFEKMGYIYLNEQSEYFREKSKLKWFKNTILVFKKTA